MRHSTEVALQIMKDHNLSTRAVEQITGLDWRTVNAYIHGTEHFSPIRVDGMLIDRLLDIVVEHNLVRPKVATHSSPDLVDTSEVDIWYDKVRALLNADEVREISKACRKIYSIVRADSPIVHEEMVLDRFGYNSGLTSYSTEAYIERTRQKMEEE